MSVLVQHSGFEPDRDALSTADSRISFFQTIPPERVGLNGEYDHNGLAKRVEQRFREQFARSRLRSLGVTQRGRVVVLAGEISDLALLGQLVRVALEIPGASHVETYGVTIKGATPHPLAD